MTGLGRYEPYRLALLPAGARLPEGPDAQAGRGALKSHQLLAMIVVDRNAARQCLNSSHVETFENGFETTTCTSTGTQSQHTSSYNTPVGWYVEFEFR